MLEAAGRLFAERAFDSVSTREIAVAAGVNLSAISYHFENKEGLYRAIFEKIVRDLKPVRVNLALVLEHQLADASEDRKAYAETVTLFVSRLVDSAISPVTRWRMRLIKREIEMPTDCFQIIMEGHINIIHDLLGILISRISGESTTSEKVRLEASSVLAICLQYALNEELVKARMGWPAIGPQEIEKIKTSMGEMVLRSLDLGDCIDSVRTG
ncbi:MAG: CerR family C-terminal domain-containing protein [Sneathiella sp.]